MTGTVSVRVNFVKSAQATGALSHAMRSVKPPKYVDRARTDLNTLVCGTSSPKLPDLAAEIEDFCKQKSGRKWRKDSQHFIDGIITFSRDANIEDAPHLDDCAQQTLQNIISEFGMKKDAVIYLERHEDESRSHYHFMLKNQLEAGKSARCKFDRQGLSKLQDIAGSSFKRMGINRGKKKSERIKDGDPDSTIIHRSVKKLHEDLPREIQQKDQVIQQQGQTIQQQQKEIQQQEQEVLAIQEKKNKIESLLLKAKKELLQEKNNAKKLLNRIEKYEIRIENYEKKIAEITLEKMPKVYKKEIKTGEKTNIFPMPKAPILKLTKVCHPSEVSREFKKLQFKNEKTNEKLHKSRYAMNFYFEIAKDFAYLVSEQVSSAEVEDKLCNNSKSFLKKIVSESMQTMQKFHSEEAKNDDGLVPPKFIRNHDEEVDHDEYNPNPFDIGM